MVDPETFLTELYVCVDDWCKTQPPPPVQPGPPARLTTSEIMTLAIYAQQTRFGSERAFYAHAQRQLRRLFPGLPSRPRFNRLRRAAEDALTAFALFIGQTLAVGDERSFETLDGTGLVVRNLKRRGRSWLAGQADVGKCTRLDWYLGVRLLLSTTPGGIITGWGIGPASTNDRTLAETFFAVRAGVLPPLPSVGTATSDCLVADMGFSGRACQDRWATSYGAVVICPPKPDAKHPWPKALRRWLGSIRQVIEAVNDRLLFRCGLDRERPHALDGLQAHLAAAIALHNVWCWFNARAGRGLLQHADLIEW